MTGWDKRKLNLNNKVPPHAYGFLSYRRMHLGGGSPPPTFLTEPGAEKMRNMKRELFFSSILMVLLFVSQVI